MLVTSMDSTLVIIRYVAGVILLMLSGYVILSFLEKVFSRGRKPFFTSPERLFISFPVGAAFLAWYMFLLGLLRIPFTMLTLGGFFFFPVMAWFLTKKYFGSANKVLPENKAGATSAHFVASWQKLFIAILVALILLRLIFVVFEIAVVPTYFDDALAHWNQRAKIFYYERGLVLDKTSPDFFGKYRPEYPLYTHMTKVYLSIFSGGWHEPVVNSLNILLAVSILGFLWLALQRLGASLISAIFAVYTIFSLPLATFQLFGGLYSDFIFGLFIAVSLICFIFWIKEPQQIFYLGLAGFFFAIASFTKIEPLVLALVPFLIAIGFAARKIRLNIFKTIAIFLAPIILYLGPWLALKIFLRLPLFSPGGVSSGFFQPRLDLLPQMLNVLLFEGNYNIFFVIVGFIIFVVWQKLWANPLRYAAIFVWLFLTAILYIFLFTASSQWLADQTTFNRTMIGFLPSAIVLLAFAVNGVLADDAKSVSIEKQ